ncbi:MAG: TVP38/TMEM64 family protein [Elainella sp.]
MRQLLQLIFSGLGRLGIAVLLLSPIVVLVVLCLPAPVNAALLNGFAADLRTPIEQALSQIQALGGFGVAVFIGLYALATVAFIPGSLLTLGAGAIYGVVEGSLYVMLGASLGALLAFGVGRYLARDWVARKIEADPKFKAIDQAVSRDGFKIVLLTRLSPLFPFTLLNYAFGITNVRWRDYLLGCIGMLPGTLLYVYLGSLTGSLAQLGDTAAPSGLQWASRLVGLAATLAVTLYITRIARQALAESTAPEPPLSNDSP